MFVSELCMYYVLNKHVDVGSPWNTKWSSIHVLLYNTHWCIVYDAREKQQQRIICIAKKQ